MIGGSASDQLLAASMLSPQAKGGEERTLVDEFTAATAATATASATPKPPAGSMIPSKASPRAGTAKAKAGGEAKATGHGYMADVDLENIMVGNMNLGIDVQALLAQVSWSLALGRGG